jgi:hypothetical protein
MAIESFVAEAGRGGDLSSEEVAYVDALVDHARSLE